MNVLIVNAGSSSMKYQVIEINKEEVLAKGLVERIGMEGSLLKHTPCGRDKVTIEKPIADHIQAIELIMKVLVDSEYGVLKSMDEINAVGHRVVHGGEEFSQSVLIDDNVMQAIRRNCELAPLHNPANIMGIEACMKVLGNVLQVAVFDTAFHQTMPPKAYLYALPHELYTRYHIRRYGFHGTSHRYVSERAAQILGKPLSELKIITCHLGNGSSVAAVERGRSVDTTMGFTPIEGLPMGTRSGDIDIAIAFYLMEKECLGLDKINELLNKKSGMLGLSGVSSDFRDLWAAADCGNKLAREAIEVFCYKVKKYIGAYAAAMGGVDCVVFTAGIGENDSGVRSMSCEGLEFLGIKIDPARNDGARGREGIITTEDSKVKVMVVPTNEELVIARDTVALIKKAAFV